LRHALGADEPLQPHFLFNAWNAVSAAIYEDPNRADRMLERLSDFLRATLRVPESSMFRCRRSLSLAQYLEVMKTRLEDRLQFEIDATRRGIVRVPALLLGSRCWKTPLSMARSGSGRVDVSLEATRNERIRDHLDFAIAAADSSDGPDRTTRIVERPAEVEDGLCDHASLGLAGRPSGWGASRCAHSRMIRAFLVEDEPRPCESWSEWSPRARPRRVRNSVDRQRGDYGIAARTQIRHLDIRLPDGNGSKSAGSR